MGKRDGEQADGWGTGAHPVLAASSALHRALDSAHGAVAAGSDPAWLSAADQGRLLEDLGRARQRLDALLIHALAASDRADGVTSLDGSRSPADWLAHRLHVRPGRLAADAKLGTALENRQYLTTALSAGAVTVEHARAVVDVLADLPSADLEPEVLAEAERVLVGHCADFTPPEVRRLGRHLLDVVAPDVAEAIEARRLADQERAARRKTTLRLRRTPDGTRRITGEIPELHASILEAALRAITNPRRAQHDTEPDAPRTTADDGQRITDSQRLGQAFCTLIEHLRADKLPTHGRSPVTVTVTISEEKLREDAAGLGLLDTGAEISLGEVRRLTCQYGIRAAVLGARSEVLDLGREQRLYNHPQRAALAIAHPECQARGCTVPAAWCEAHHRQPWSIGGRTDLADGGLLCPHHHRLAHDPAYETCWHGDGSGTFHRRC